VVGRNKLLLLVLFGVSVIFIALSFNLMFFTERPLNVVEYDVEFVVEEGRRVGFDVNDSLLIFGKVGPGGGGTRKVVIINDYSFTIEARTFLSKNLIGLIDVNHTVFVEPRMNATVPVELNVPVDFEDGNYSGKIKFELYKAEGE